MPAATWNNQTRTAWEDQFNRPTGEELVEHYEPQTRALFEHIITRLQKLGPLNIKLEWMGLPWRWCLLINPEDMPEDADRAWAYLVPQLEAPLLVMPIDLFLVEKLPMRRIKKHVREQVAKGRTIDHMTYAEWTVTAKTQLEDMMDMINRLYKLRHQTPESAPEQHTTKPTK